MAEGALDAPAQDSGQHAERARGGGASFVDVRGEAADGRNAEAEAEGDRPLRNRWPAEDRRGQQADRGVEWARRQSDVAGRHEQEVAAPHH